jgi:starvation-inducible DNA-binding protein
MRQSSPIPRPVREPWNNTEGAEAPEQRLRSSVAVLEEVLTESIRLRDSYKHARLQIPSGRSSELSRVLNEHYQEQVELVDVIVDRIRALGGAVGVFASEFLQSPQYCRMLRGPSAFQQLLRGLLDAHESILSTARPPHANDDAAWMHDFAVGRVVLANEQQCDVIDKVLHTNAPGAMLRQTDV